MSALADLQSSTAALSTSIASVATEVAALKAAHAACATDADLAALRVTIDADKAKLDALAPVAPVVAP